MIGVVRGRAEVRRQGAPEGTRVGAHSVCLHENHKLPDKNETSMTRVAHAIQHTTAHHTLHSWYTKPWHDAQTARARVWALRTHS